MGSEVTMSERESEQRGSSRADDAQVEDSGVVSEDLAARKEQLDADVDAMLDEIDDVLEENAEEFVRGFVQKGGQ